MSLSTEITRTVRTRLLSPGEMIQSVFRVSLYRNTVFLVIRSFIDAVSGYFFWIIATKLYSAEEIGIASALVSAMLLFGITGTLGLGISFIRFCSEAPSQKRLLNVILTISILVSSLAALVFIVGLGVWSPSLSFIRQQPYFAATFIVFVITCAVSTILSHVIIAFRRNDLNVYYGLISLLRLGLLVPFAFLNDGFGIFIARGVGETLTILAVFLFFLPRLMPGYTPAFSLDKGLFHKLGQFTITNFLAETAKSLPSWVLPIMVVNILGAEANAHFYMSWTVASAVLVVSMLAPLSLFAEGSRSIGNLGGHFRKAITFSLLMLVPLALLICIFGDRILSIFGQGYSANGITVLHLLTIAAIPTGVNHLYISVARVEKRLAVILWVTGLTTIGTLVLSYLLVKPYGISGIGIGWLASQTLVMLGLLPAILRLLRTKELTAGSSPTP